LRYRVAIRFEIRGDLRFISHRDTMRLFERALARARLPVRFSRGFNPRPRISLPLPRPVGVASTSELLVVELSEAIEPAEVVDRLIPQMPEDLIPVEAWRIDTGASPQPDQVSYEVSLGPEHVPAVTAAVAGLLAADRWLIDRPNTKGHDHKVIDIRSYVVSAAVEGETLRWTVQVTPGGTVRPAEMLAAWGLEPSGWRHRIRRTHVSWVGTPSPSSIQPPNRATTP